MDVGNFSWAPSAGRAGQRIMDVVCSASSNSLVPTETMGKKCFVLMDSTP